MIRSISIGVYSLAAMGLASCAVFGPAERARPLESQAFTNAPASATRPNLNAWWTAFEDPDVDQIVVQALKASPGIQEAAGKLRQARALAEQAGAAQLPSLDATAQAARTRLGGQQAPSAAKDWQSSLTLGLSASYELDLWGRVTSAVTSAEHTAEAVRFDAQTARITIASESVLRVLRLKEARTQLRLLEVQLPLAKKQVELVRLRNQQGIASLDAVITREQESERLGAELSSLREKVQGLQGELSVLLGTTALPKLSENPGKVPAILGATGLPSELLSNRPDVAASWERLIAADWQLSSAKADRLPSLRLSAGISTSDTKTQDLFNNWFANLVGGLVGPILDGGRRASEVERVKGLIEERAAIHRRMVLTAISEVENALVAERERGLSLENARQDLALANNSRSVSALRSRQGLDDLAISLDAELRSLRLERTLVERHRLCQEARISLVRALGGEISP